MSPEHSISIGGKQLPLLFTVGSMSRLQREAGIKLGDFISMFSARPEMVRAAQDGDQVRLAQLWFEHTGILEIQGLLFAGLEGARAKERYRMTAYTFDQAGDLLEQVDDGMLGAFNVLIPAFTDFLQRFMVIRKSDDGEAKNVPTEESSTPEPKTSGKSSTSRRAKPA